MNYELKHFDETLLRFFASEDTNTPEIKILWLNERKKDLLPLDLGKTENGLLRWLRHRTIPKNRANVHNFLSKCNLSINRPMSIIKVSKGLSLNDCYWIVEDGFNGKFDDYNLYENKFSRILSLIAFSGYGSYVRLSIMSSPEFTTNGMLPKCWRRINKKVLLYKGGTTGASNTGNEPYSEYYAYQIAKVLGINAIEYKLSKWKGVLCSTCELFTSKNVSFVPVGRIVRSGGFEAVKSYYEGLGPHYMEAFHDMLVFDALIMNTDRHFGNFGFLVDSQNNQIIAPAPLFDHGNSLLNYAGKDSLKDIENLQVYANTLLPCVYDDFIHMAKKGLTLKHREGLRKLLTFHFKANPRYNLDKKRLKLLEQLIQSRAALLLEE